MNEKKSVELAEIIKTLKEELLCPICLDITQDVIEFCCGHKLCSDCYMECKSSKLVCPVCKNIMNKRSFVYKDEYLNNLGKFVSNLCDKFEEIYQCKIEEYALKKCNKNGSEHNKTPKENQCSTSKTTAHKLKELSQKSVTSNKEDAFDKLLIVNISQRSLRVNKTGKKRAYANKKKKERDKDITLLDFENDKNKVSVIHWLDDTRNIFDRLTQTQNVHNESEIDTSLIPENFPSISQRRTLDDFIKPVKIFKKGRSKSMDLELKKADKIKHSDRCSEAPDNYNIEEINTEEEKVVEKAEENVLLNFIEDEFLDKLETELDNHAVSSRTRKKSESNTMVSLNSTAVSHTGWDRVTEIKKSLKKSSKEPKQLKIVMDSSERPHVKKDKAFVREKTQTGDVRFIVTEQKTSKVEVKDKMVDSKTKKTYDLHDVEKYMSAHIQKGTKEIDVEIIEKRNDSKESTNQDKKIDENNSSDQLDRQNDETNLYIPLARIEKDTNPDLMDPYMLPTQKLLSKDENGNTNDDDDRETVAPTQKINLNVTTTSEKDEVVDLDDFPQQVQQVSYIVLNPNVTDLLNLLEKNVNAYIEDAEHDVMSTKRKLHSVASHINKLKVLLQTKDQVSKIASVTTDIAVQTSTNVSDVAVQTSVLLSEKSVETLPVGTCQASAQTEIEIIDRGVQTTLKGNNYSQNNFESLSSERQKSLKDEIANSITQGTKLAMESILSEPDICLSTKSKESQKRTPLVEVNVPVSAKTKTQSEIFTASFDNLNFETQELARQFLIEKKSAQKLEVFSESKPKENSPKSVGSTDEGSPQGSKESRLVCTIPSDTSKRINRKLQFNPDENSTKRQRISSDSDSDEEIRPRRKKNRFINNNLSVEFESNTEKFNLQSGCATPESENINYEDCLDKILKNYDNNCGSTTRNDAKSQRNNQNDNDKSTKNLLKECDEVIAEVNKNVENLKKQKNASVSNISRKSLPRKCIVDSSNKSDVSIRKSRNLLSEELHSEFSDVIGETEEMEPLPKKMKTKCKKASGSFSKSSKSVKRATQKNDDGLCDELNDSFDEAELEKIDLPGRNNIKSVGTPKIRIIADVVVTKVGSNEGAEEDLFSDDDVVETTPQKNKSGLNVWFPEPNASDILNNDMNVNPSQHIEDFDLDLTLPPPPDFQDNFEVPTHSKSIKETKFDEPLQTYSSLTPDDLSQYIRKETPNKQRSTFEQTPHRSTKPAPMNFSHSTPSCQVRNKVETLGFSPIPNEYDVVESPKTRNAILTSATRQNTSKQTIMTSTPKQKSIWNYVRPSSQTNEEADLLPTTSKLKPTIACTRLSAQQIMLVTQLTNKKLAAYSSAFNYGVTHMIVAVDERNCLKDYTVKFVAAVAAGLWVLRFGWVQECLNQNRIVPEELFEVLDDSGGSGPKTARLTRKQNPLFKNFKFYCPNQFISTTKQDIEDIIRTLGGKVVAKIENLRELDGRIALIITEGRATQDFDIYEKWLETFRIATVDIEWLSKSIGRYKILSILPYVWCSDDNLGNFGYPDYLIENVPFTASEQM